MYKWSNGLGIWRINVNRNEVQNICFVSVYFKLDPLSSPNLWPFGFVEKQVNLLADSEDVPWFIEALYVLRARQRGKRHQ